MLAIFIKMVYTVQEPAGVMGSKGSAACGGSSDPSEWQRPRCSALPVADAAEHKRVPGSIADAAALSARKISGHPKRAADDDGVRAEEYAGHLPSRILWVLSWRDKKVPPPAGTGTFVCNQAHR